LQGIRAVAADAVNQHFLPRCGTPVVPLSNTMRNRRRESPPAKGVRKKLTASERSEGSGPIARRSFAALRMTLIDSSLLSGPYWPPLWRFCFSGRRKAVARGREIAGAAALRYGADTTYGLSPSLQISAIYANGVSRQNTASLGPVFDEPKDPVGWASERERTPKSQGRPTQQQGVLTCKNSPVGRC
jgi:hypothetical protein